MTQLKKILVVLVPTLVLGIGVVAVAQHAGGDIETGKRWLALMNHKGDTDNTISKREFDRYMNTQFDKADADHDGTLDAAELGRLKAMLDSQ